MSGNAGITWTGSAGASGSGVLSSQVAITISASGTLIGFLLAEPIPLNLTITIDAEPFGMEVDPEPFSMSTDAEEFTMEVER